MYIYSAYINTKVSLFYPRYFIVLLPHGYFILATFLHKILKIKTPFNYIFVLVITSSITYLLLSNDITFDNSWHIDYNELALYLTNNNDITNSDCIIINNTNSFYSGFIEFYFENKNRSIPNKTVNYITQEELKKYNIIYYIYDQMNNSNFFDYDIIEFLNNNYQLVNYDEKIRIFKYAK